MIHEGLREHRLPERLIAPPPLAGHSELSDDGNGSIFKFLALFDPRAVLQTIQSAGSGWMEFYLFKTPPAGDKNVCRLEGESFTRYGDRDGLVTSILALRLPRHLVRF